MWLDVMPRPMFRTCSSVVCKIMYLQMKLLNYNCLIPGGHISHSREGTVDVEEKWPRPQSMKTKPHVQYCSWCLWHGQAKAGHFRLLDQQTIVAEGVLRAVFACDNFFHTVNVSLDHCAHNATVTQAEAVQSKRIWRERISRVKTSINEHCRVDGACDNIRSSSPNPVQYQVCRSATWCVCR